MGSGSGSGSSSVAPTILNVSAVISELESEVETSPGVTMLIVFEVSVASAKFTESGSTGNSASADSSPNS